ncbi:hypothetical protein SRABI134_02328 [Peribacillus sp. Bi134]|nr:hypothetical protein SRABI134_02328 [Peribacillus sp. Bi134]
MVAVICSLYLLQIQLKNQKGFGMKPFRNLFVYKLKHPYRMRFFLENLIAEFLQLGIGAELSGMPL